MPTPFKVAANKEALATLMLIFPVFEDKACGLAALVVDAALVLDAVTVFWL